MTDAQLEALQLTRERATVAADFFTAYAAHAQGRADDAADPTPVLMDAASALRVAGQWAMLFDRPRATALLVRSAHIWHGLGHGFGTFLLTALAPDEIPRGDVNRRVRQLLRLHSPEPGEGDRTEDALTHPQQQAYLSLAAAADTTVERGPLRQGLLALCDAPAHRQGVAPIGSLGTPIQAYWDIARGLLSGDRESTARTVADHLGRMALAYDRNISLAMANSRLWSNAAAPVDTVDVDIMGIARNAAYRIGRRRLTLELTSRAEQMPRTAQVAMEVAVLSVQDMIIERRERFFDEWGQSFDEDE